VTLQEGIEKFDQVFGSTSRPAIAIMCGASVAASCLSPNAAIASIAIPSATGIVIAYIGTRGFENNAKIKAASADKASLAATDIASQPGATSTVCAEVPGP
jgi:hypothetical protein